MTALDEIKAEDIKEEYFKIYVAGLMEPSIEFIEDAEQLNTLLKKTYKEANATLGTKFKKPRIKKENIPKRLKDCVTCGQPFFDISVKNKVKTCHRSIFFGRNGRQIFEGDTLVTECRREYRAAPHRKEKNIFALSGEMPRDDNVVSTPIEDLADKIDENGNSVNKGKRRTVSVDNKNDYGAYGGSIQMDVEKAIVGVFHNDGTIKDKEKYDALPDWAKEAHKPSEVSKYNVFQRDWSDLDDGLRKVYGSEAEFERMKSANRKAG